jgi:hypothetical protein
MKTVGPMTQVLLYYFFDFNDTEKCSIEGFLRSLVHQAFCKVAGAELILGKEYSSTSSTQLALPTLFRLLRDMLAQSKDVNILIDALDEW